MTNCRAAASIYTAGLVDVVLFNNEETYIKMIKYVVLPLLAGDAVSPNSEQFFLQVRLEHSDECSFCAAKNVMRTESSYEIHM